MCGRGDCRPLHTIRFEPLQRPCEKCGGDLPFCKCFVETARVFGERFTAARTVESPVLRTFVTEDGVEVVDEEV